VLTIVLVDIRHDPSPIDLSLIEELENAQRRYVVVLTKSDKVSKTFVREREEQLRELTSLCQSCVDILPYSSVEGGGRPQLLGIIRKACLAE
jgi:GTP-binding protein